MDAFVKILAYVPKNFLSWLTGFVVRLRLPFGLQGALNLLFVRLFGIDMSEAEKPLASYRTIEDVFTRKLKPHVRPVQTSVCSPADGILSISAPAHNGEAVQVKGLTYRLDELVFGAQRKEQLAWYATVYLAPHNYHRVHAPVAGVVESIRYFPGELWPVNQPAVRTVPGLFVRNERLVFDFRLEGGGRCHVVMVGALNVGRMTSPLLPDFCTNALHRQLGALPREWTGLARSTKVGEELGTFLLGSTVVVVFDQEAARRFRFVQTGKNAPIMMGRSLLAGPRIEES